MIEQRKNQRFDLHLPFEILSDGGKEAVAGQTKNVSSAGVLFSTESPVGIGEAIEYVITFPKAPKARTPVKLHCVGKVLREDKSAYVVSLERYEFIRG
jgi:hypothetical protein